MPSLLVETIPNTHIYLIPNSIRITPYLEASNIYNYFLFDGYYYESYDRFRSKAI
jgi:hypothetical protein